MGGSPTPAPVVRDMVPGDLEQITDIYIKALGKQRPNYWQMKVQQAAGNPQFCGLVAELEGQVAGFIIGGVNRWEYGMPANISWDRHHRRGPGPPAPGPGQGAFWRHGPVAQADGRHQHQHLSH